MSASVGPESEVLMNIAVSNESVTAFTLKSLTAKDRFGLALPSVVELTTPALLIVGGQASAETVFLLWIPDSVVGDIDHFEVSD